MNEKKPKIIFVCTGNTCRSPMAEIILKSVLKSKGWQGLTIASAGISARRGSTINPKSLQILQENGFSIDKFSSKRLTDKMMKEAYAIVCMTEEQREYLLDARWQVMRKSGEENFENNVYSFGEIAGYDILDPYGKDIDCYRYVFELIQGGMPMLIEKLQLCNIAKMPKKRGRPKTK